ncbi:MAG: hypothetical protein ACRC2T_12465 [Thermoguttaceae bacterium]
MYPTTVTVYKDNSPLDQVQVSFIDSSNPEYVIVGETNSSGKAVMKTQTSHYSASGAPAGTFGVRLNKIVQPKSLISDKELAKMNTEQYREYMAKKTQENFDAEQNPIIPPSLSDLQQSPLSIEVTEKGGELKVEVSEYE